MIATAPAPFEEATDPATPPERLKALAEDASLVVQRAVAANPNTPFDCLKKLWCRFPEALLENSWVDLHVLVSDEPLCEKIDDCKPLAALSVHLFECNQISTLKRLIPDNYRIRVMLLTFQKSMDDGEYVVDSTHPKRAISRTRIEQCLACDPLEEIRVRLARNAETPKIISAFVNDESIKTRTAVAANRHITAKQCEVLLINACVDLRSSLAINTSATPTTLSELSRDPETKVRELVARNISTPKVVLEHLSKDKEDCVRLEVGGNRNTSQSLLRQWAMSETRGMRQVVAGNHSTPTPELARLAQDADEWVGRDAIKNPAMPLTMLVDAIAKSRENHQHQFPRDRKLSTSFHRQLIKRGTAPHRVVQAGLPGLPKNILESLAADRSPEVRRAVAERLLSPNFLHPNRCNFAAIALLAADSRAENRALIASDYRLIHPFPEQDTVTLDWVRERMLILRKLIQDPADRVRLSAMSNVFKAFSEWEYNWNGNPATRITDLEENDQWAELLLPVACDKTLSNRLAAAAHPLASAALLGKMMHDKNKKVRLQLAERTNIPRAELCRLALDPATQHLFPASEPVRLSREVIRHLSTHSNPYLRGMAARNPRCTMAMAEALADDPVATVRLCICFNSDPNCGVLRRLASDTDSLVRHSASKILEN